MHISAYFQGEIELRWSNEKIFYVFDIYIISHTISIYNTIARYIYVVRGMIHMLNVGDNYYLI